MSIDGPIDVDSALKTLGFELKGYFSLLMMFEDSTLLKSLANANEALNKENYDDLKHHIHSLKGASSYIAASHLHYSCYFMQLHYQEG